MIVTVPPIRISPITDTTVVRRWVAGQTPINLTGWSAEFLLIHCREVVFRADVDLSSDGFLTVLIPADIGDQHRCKPLTHQFNINGPDDFDEVWRGPASVLEVSA